MEAKMKKRDKEYYSRKYGPFIARLIEIENEGEERAKYLAKLLRETKCQTPKG